MTIRDRGNIKWTALMLPEHVAMVKKVYADQNKVAKPTLDEQEIEEIERVINGGMSDNLQLVFTYWKNGYFKTLIGRVYRIDHIGRHIRVEDEFRDRVNIDIDVIIDVRIGD